MGGERDQREKLVFDVQNTGGISVSGNPAIANPIVMLPEKDFIPRTSL
jgi:hypothetical protein